MFRNIMVFHGHGITVGSEMSAGVRNVLFENIVLNGTARGIRIKSEAGRGGIVENIVYRNIDMVDVQIAIQVTMKYHNYPQHRTSNVSATPIFRDILLQNVRAVDSLTAFDIQGLPESHIQNLTLSNVFVNSFFLEGSCKAAELNCIGSMCPCRKSIDYFLVIAPVLLLAVTLVTLSLLVCYSFKYYAF